VHHFALRSFSQRDKLFPCLGLQVGKKPCHLGVVILRCFALRHLKSAIYKLKRSPTMQHANFALFHLGRHLLRGFASDVIKQGLKAVASDLLT
jgi:hypothetical protein